MDLVENPVNRIWRFTPLAIRETGFLLAIDGVTNLADYAFHVTMGRQLAPGEFAVLQTINSSLLILLTAFAVMEPVVARYVAEARAGGQSEAAGRLTPGHVPVLFQRYLRGSAGIGLILAVGVWLGKGQLAAWLGVPPMAIGLVAVMPILGLLRPVVSGTFQGERRFVLYGLARSTYALGRLATGILLVGLGNGLAGAIGALPLGSVLALLGGLLFLAAYFRGQGPPLPAGLFRDTLRLSAGAFVAYAAYMILLNADLLWVNRSLSPEFAGSYASAVLLRRAFSLLPGAVVVVMYPRAIASVLHGKLPDRLLVKTAGAILVTGALLTGVYFALGEDLLALTFGPRYLPAGALLGWMGLGVVGYSLTALWMNFYLATRPWPFILLLALAAGLQNLLLASYHAAPAQVLWIFGACGWSLAAAGLALYLLWLRPALANK